MDFSGLFGIGASDGWISRHTAAARARLREASIRAPYEQPAVGPRAVHSIEDTRAGQSDPR